MASLPAANGYATAATVGAKKTWVEGLRSFVAQLLGGQDEAPLVIAGGSVTPLVGSNTIDTEGGAATDDLANALQGNFPEGSYLMLRALDAAKVTTIKHAAGGAGQFNLADQQDALLDDPDDFMLFVRDGNLWREVFRSRAATRLSRIRDNAAGRTLLAWEHDSTQTNRGAGARVDLVMVAVPGWRQRGYVQNANGLRFVCPGAATIRNVAGVSAPGGYVQDLTVGAYVEVECLTATEFVVSMMNGGAWTPV